MKQGNLYVASLVRRCDAAVCQALLVRQLGGTRYRLKKAAPAVISGNAYSPLSRITRSAYSRSRVQKRKSLANARLSHVPDAAAELLGELRDLMGQTRYLPARIVLVNDVALGGLHQLGLGALHGVQRCGAVALCDGVFNDANRSAHLGAARLVDDGAAGNLARRLLGRSGVGHVLSVLQTGGFSKAAGLIVLDRSVDV